MKLIKHRYPSILCFAFTVQISIFCDSLDARQLVADSGYARHALQSCNTDLVYLNHVLGWQVEWPSRWQAVVAHGPEHARNAITLWSSAPEAITRAISNLKTGIEREETAPRAVVERILHQLAELLEELANRRSKYVFTDTSHKHAVAWNSLVTNDIALALREFDNFIYREYLPKVSPTPGLRSTEGVDHCFFNAAAWWTGLRLTQEETETIGWQYLNETKKALLTTVTNGEKIDAVLQDLRMITQKQTTTAADLIAISKSAIKRARQKTELVFSTSSSHPIVVEALPKHLQDTFPAGRYRKGQGDMPARYIINTSRPQERRLMAEVIAFHESIPGHHLWSTYPRTTKQQYDSGIAGLLEGWAIYAEYLADEAGLYSSMFDRQGMMAKHLWAASRLVVEPGLHLRGWSREQAIRFMLKHTILSRTEIEIEVDRYIAMPGQSLSYILGAHTIINERERAREIMGTDFDIKKFHDIVLQGGARPLPVARDDIRAWVREHTSIMAVPE